MYKKHTLSNGVRIIIEDIPYVKSVSVGIWIKTGSRNENIENNGISHFIEHMLFKGTSNRTAKQIAEEIDGIGGQLNAFTSKECTCYYAKVLDNHLPTAIDILSDMFFNSIFNEDDIQKEKGVVLEEINMYEDSPEDLVHDLLAKTIFKGSTLSYPILGYHSTLKNITRDKILDYMNKFYTPENTVISIAGRVDINKTIDLVDSYFGGWKNKHSLQVKNKFVEIKKGFDYKNKNTEQLHLTIGMEGLKLGDEDLYALLVLNNIFGGSMSSRLFQNLREDKGLVYSIYSFPSSYEGIGTFNIYAGLSPNQIINATKLIIEEINSILENEFTFEEVNKAKEQLKGNYILGLESTSSRMTSLGKSELLIGRINSPQEILDKINRVTIYDVNRIKRNVFNNEKYNFAYVGNLNDDNLNENIKKILY